MRAPLQPNYLLNEPRMINSMFVGKIILNFFVVLFLIATSSFAAGGGDNYVKDYKFSFEGPLGSYDQNQLQRGLKVYTEICSACHGLKYVPIRTLGDEGGLGYSEDQVRAYAENYEIFDPELDDYRPAKPTDHFPEIVDAGALIFLSWQKLGPDFMVLWVRV